MFEHRQPPPPLAARAHSARALTGAFCVLLVLSGCGGGGGAGPTASPTGGATAPGSVSPEPSESPVESPSGSPGESVGPVAGGPRVERPFVSFNAPDGWVVSYETEGEDLISMNEAPVAPQRSLIVSESPVPGVEADTQFERGLARDQWRPDQLRIDEMVEISGVQWYFLSGPQAGNDDSRGVEYELGTVFQDGIDAVSVVFSFRLDDFQGEVERRRIVDGVMNTVVLFPDGSNA